MNSSGLSDSFGATGAIAPCPRCHTTARLSRGLCLGCLLSTVFDEKERPAEEDFATLLEALPVSHTHWRVANYEILEEIGRGGMGVIYRARQRHSRRIVALKRVLSYQSESRETLTRFRREAEAAASLDHPNILPIYEVGETEEGVPYFSMKYAAGGSLQEIGSALRHKPRQVVGLLGKVTRAVEYAHSQGILHRDLKPGNILLDARGEPLVSDFGLAKWLDASTNVTQTLAIFGTPGYIAPEQSKGSPERLTPAADIYSLGAVLFFLLTGRSPFLGDTALAVIQQAAEKAAPKLHSLVTGVDKDLETICAKCLERDPLDRYRSAGALADDLQRWLEGKAIAAHALIPPARVWRWSKRNPTLAAATMAALIFAATAGLLFLAQPSPRQSSLSPKGIAVLPFENLGDKQNAYFCEGVHHAILTNLARISDLKVISQTSVLPYQQPSRRNSREMGQALGVGNLLEGSVQREGDKVRVNAQLIDARTDANLWAESYERNLADIFAIQTDISSKVSEQLKARLSPSEKQAIRTPATHDLTAYDLFIRAQAIANDLTNQVIVREKAPIAIRLLEEAVARDPNFTRALYLLSRIHGQMYWAGFDHTPARLAMAKDAAEAALRTSPDNGEAHLAMADYYYHGFRDYKRARAELNAARPTLPNNPQVFEYSAYIERRQGDWNTADRDFERASELDPRNFQIFQQLALTYQLQHRYPEQLRALEHALTVVPDDLSTLVLRAWLPVDWRADLRPFMQFRAGLMKKDPATANEIEDINYALCERTDAAITRTLATYPPDGFVYNGIKFPRSYWLGVVARFRGEKENAASAFADARRQVEEIAQKQPDFPAALSLLGLIDAGLRKKSDALREARRACELLPAADDAVDGVAYATNLAQVYTWTGEKELALDQLEKVESRPNFLSYGYLKLQLIWDPLRGNPRFEKIVASLAPIK